MITLYGSNPIFGLPEASPYVMKTEIHLQMAGIPYRKVAAMPAEGPKGKVPFIDDDGVMLGDSTFIRAHIEATRGIDLDEGLSASDRAGAWAVERMLEDNLAAASGYFRWIPMENFTKGPAHFLDGVPETHRAAAQADLYARVKENMTIQGMARHSEAEILFLAGKSLSALSLFIGDKDFLFGARPTGSDAIVYAILAGILTPFFDTELRRMALGHPNLVAHAARMQARFYPDFEAALAA